MSKRWLKILLVVAMAFAFTMSVEVVGRWSAHGAHEIPSLWLVLTLPGSMLTDCIKSHVNLNLWLPIDSTVDPQVVWRKLVLAFNALFYSGLFWLISLFCHPISPTGKPLHQGIGEGDDRTDNPRGGSSPAAWNGRHVLTFRGHLLAWRRH